MPKAVVLSFLTFVIFALAIPTHGRELSVYLNPRPGASLVQVETSIALRQGETLDKHSINDTLFHVVGSVSGRHMGTAVLSDDQRTVIFTPEQPFMPGEVVSVTIASGIRTISGGVIDQRMFTFTTAPQRPTAEAAHQRLSDAGSGHTNASSTTADAVITSAPYVTVPDDFPKITVTTPAQQTAEGYLFLSSFNFPQRTTSKPYLLILDNAGEPIYYKKLDEGNIAVDFKKQPNGLLTYWNPTENAFQAMDTSYTIVDTFKAGNGYVTDLHELQLLPNGHALLMIYDYQKIDMSKIVEGGKPDATVIGLVIQELDASKNVVFEWRSWDHFEITDATVPLTGDIVDYAHGNAIDLDFDGNLLISSRHMDEITKINRQTGNIIWRWGGKNNQFTFVRGEEMFVHQHDVRRLPGGTVTLFDNRTNTPEPYSRVLEYRLDEFNKTATLVWEYRNSPDVYSVAMGNAQRVSNGNTIIGWGSSRPNLTEVRPDGTKAFELTFDAPLVSYRAFRFPWQGQPVEPPVLVASNDNCAISLSYSWNGATEIAAYQVYGGTTSETTTLIETRPRAGFETQTTLSTNRAGYKFFRVMPIDKNGRETQSSNIASVDTSACSYPTNLFLPQIPNPSN